MHFRPHLLRPPFSGQERCLETGMALSVPKRCCRSGAAPEAGFLALIKNRLPAMAFEMAYLSRHLSTTHNAFYKI